MQSPSGAIICHAIVNNTGLAVNVEKVQGLSVD
jgi:hypothetical protein